MNTQPKTVQEVIENYEPQAYSEFIDNYECLGRISEDKTAVAWDWEDLFGSSGSDGLVWKLEMLGLLLARVGNLATHPSYEHGMLIGAEIDGPNEPEMPYECPWWHWRKASDAKQMYRERGDEYLLQEARGVMHDIYNWFSGWPPQSMLILHFADQVERKPPMVFGS